MKTSQKYIPAHNPKLKDFYGFQMYTIMTDRHTNHAQLNVDAMYTWNLYYLIPRTLEESWNFKTMKKMTIYPWNRTHHAHPALGIVNSLHGAVS